jgi:hypothetical protein
MNKKIIIINESQYNKIFLNEEKVLLNEWDWDYHDVLNGLALAALFIPTGGPLISAAIEGINAIGYLYEGDYLTGGIALGFSLIPGGGMLLKQIGRKGLSKEMGVLSQTLSKEIKSGRLITKDAFEEAIKKSGLSARTIKNNRALIDEYFSAISKMGTKEFKTKFANFEKLMTKTSAYFDDFMKNPELMQKYMNKNGDDLYKAYSSYLKKEALKDAAIGSSILGLLYLTDDDEGDLEKTKDDSDRTKKDYSKIEKTLDWIIKNKKLLKLGDKNNIVQDIKESLTELGYNLKVNYYFDNKTKKVVEEFQSDNNLKVDGVVGPETTKKIKELLLSVKQDSDNNTGLSIPDLEDFLYE